MFFDVLATAVAIAVIAQYTWSMRGHFSSKSMPRGAVVISVVVLLSTALLLVLQWTLAQPAWAVLLGIALELGSLVLFWAAIRASRQARLRLAFDEENPDTLVTEGPYRYLRHPFYTSYLIFWTGWAIAVWSVWALVPLLAIAIVYVIAAKGEERKFERTTLADQYRAYKRRTGFLWPRFPS
ncbi:MAG TPA: isoprenylcysteine carboxylmethyltransferase family protein [Devosiaceae bacterium]|nr:isoprenylcysteine carboxylmethyltransferase family protein [Devosiaceae bacterium]